MPRRHLRRLVRALERQGILSRSEAECAIRDYRAGHDWSCEAVNHYGGARRLIVDAFRNRHLWRF